MNINFYEKERMTCNKEDVEISKTKTGFRLSIDRNIAEKMFGASEYIQIGFDESQPDRMFFIASDKKKGFKIALNSPHRVSVNLSKGITELQRFTGSYTVTTMDDGISYISKGIRFLEK